MCSMHASISCFVELVYIFSSMWCKMHTSWFEFPAFIHGEVVVSRLCSFLVCHEWFADKSNHALWFVWPDHFFFFERGGTRSKNSVLIVGRPLGHLVWAENPKCLRIFLSPYVNTASPFTSPEMDGQSRFSSILACRVPVRLDRGSFSTDRFEVVHTCLKWL